MSQIQKRATFLPTVLMTAIMGGTFVLLSKMTQMGYKSLNSVDRNKDDKGDVHNDKKNNVNKERIFKEKSFLPDGEKE